MRTMKPRNVEAYAAAGFILLPQPQCECLTEDSRGLRCTNVARFDYRHISVCQTHANAIRNRRKPVLHYVLGTPIPK